MFVSETVPVQLGIYWSRALDVRFAGISPTHAWWRQAMEAVRTGAIDPIPLISHRAPLEEAPHMYELFESRLATKVVLHP